VGGLCLVPTAPSIDGGIDVMTATDEPDALVADAPVVDAPGPDAPVPDAGPPVIISILKATASGRGTVTTSIAGISCGPTCTSASHVFAAGSTVTIEALPEAGSVFRGWTGDCSGLYRFCTFTADGTAAPALDTVEHTLVFVPSETYAADFGSAEAADAKCQMLASAAGLAGTYVALVSAPGHNARARFVVPGTSGNGAV